MMNEVNHNSGRRPGSGSAGQPDPELPGRLLADLRTLYHPPASAPPEVDRAILAAARETLAARRRVIRPPHWTAATWQWATASSVAAAILLATLLWNGESAVPPVRSPIEVERAGSAVLPGDLDGNGRVDIADALFLARALERGDPHQAGWDVNRDGRVGNADVRHVARAAVDLSRRREP